MKLWQVAVGVGTVLFVGFVLMVEWSGFNQAVSIFAPLVTLTAFGFIVYALFRFIKSPKEAKGYGESPDLNFVKRSSIDVDNAKFLAANHVLKHHNVDLISVGSNASDARYLTYLEAKRCFPSSGEEAWYVRFKVHKSNYFNGLETRVIVFLDGKGNVTGEHLMNKSLGVNKELWNDPTISFVRGPPKTPKARTLKEIIARNVEETGELPDITPQQLEQLDFEKK